MSKMKRVFLVVLACFLIVGICSCGNNGEEVDTSAIEGSAADTTENMDDDGDESDTIEAEGATFALNSSTTEVRFFGEREVKDNGYFSCNYPGSGFESKLKCDGGTVSVRIMAEGECSFLVFLDGKLQKNTDGNDFFTTIGNRLIGIENVAAGEHVLKIIRATDFGIDAKIYALIFAGELLAADNANQERTFVEFIGDGVCSTVGAVGFTDNVSVTYPYLIAQQMDVDYSITAYNGYGLASTETKLGDLYGAEDSGSFTRKADIAVINVGALDVLSTGVNAVTSDKFANAYKELVKKVRLINGNNCKIVLVCTNGNDDFRNAVSNLYDGLGGEDSGYYLAMLPTSTSVPPSKSDHEAYASALMKILNEVQDYQVKPITSEQSGAGDSVAFDSDKWEVI